MYKLFSSWKWLSLCIRQNECNSTKLYFSSTYLIFSFKDQHNSDVYIWKFHSSANIDWENFKTIPSLAITDKDIIYVDHRYFVLRTENANEVVFEVYTMTKSPQRKRNIRLPKMSCRLDRSMLYYDGFVIAVLSYDSLEIKWDIFLMTQYFSVV